MTDSEHIEILCRGPRAWNAWREEHPSQVPNLDDASLTLGERQLGPINGGPINLRKVRMQRAFLRSATLLAADLEAADLSEADLAYARLERANLKSTNLSGAVLDYADFADAVFSDTNLSGASLRHVQNLTQAQIDHSICSADTILPEHLENPASRLEIVRETKVDDSFPSQPVSRNAVSKIV